VPILDLLKTQIKSNPKNRQSNRQKPEITRQGISTNSFSIPPGFSNPPDAGVCMPILDRRLLDRFSLVE